MTSWSPLLNCLSWSWWTQHGTPFGVLTASPTAMGAGSPRSLALAHHGVGCSWGWMGGCGLCWAPMQMGPKWPLPIPR